MAAKTTDWRPGPTVCRCCLSEGCYKDISTEYFWMGKREVYSEMLSETLSLSIAYSTSGGPNSNSRLICEPCISRLRDASDFKRQVQECEKTFMQYLDPGSEPLSDFDETRIEVPIESLETQVKVEQVKTEKDDASDGDFEDRADFLDDDEDDLDDQPLTRLATKIPKKESVDLLDLLESKPAEKRKSTTKAKAGPAKKAKTKKEVVKATSSKATKQTEKKKKEINPTSNAIHNAKLIVRYTTAYPFKLPIGGMVCVYCSDTYDDPTLFRKHMSEHHSNVKINTAFAHVSYGYIKIDCTDLQCRICFLKLNSLDAAVNHLVDQHHRNIDLSCDLGVQPFILPGEKWDCAICESKFISLRALSAHTQTHFAKHNCESCEKSYFYLHRLERHKRAAHIGEHRICSRCKTTFETLDAKKEHVLESPLCWEYICTLCGERFLTMALRDAHRTQLHGMQSKSFVCSECPKVFANRRVYKRHFTIAHTNAYFACECGKKFGSQFDLKEHMVVHTKEKSFICTVCSKPFARKNNLVQHMSVHSDQKRFECVDCDKQFKQRASWRTHMRIYHPGVPLTLKV